MSGKSLYQTDVPGFPVHRGKVRDVIDLGSRLLIVATDRISAYDRISPTLIPGKGVVLNQLSAFWFKLLAEAAPWLKTHFMSADWKVIASWYSQLAPYHDQLVGRSMLVQKADRVFGVEAIVRAYLYGSGWKDYCDTGNVCGITMPVGMRMAEELPFTMFAPSTKAAAGAHDENISVEEAIRRNLMDWTQATAIAGASIAIFDIARDYAAKRSIIVADTKFEFGMRHGQLMLVDEVLTPDSSRFWPADQYQPGREQPSYDKQPVRDYLEGEVTAGRWSKQAAEAPELPAEVVEATTQRYEQILAILTA